MTASVMRPPGLTVPGAPADGPGRYVRPVLRAGLGVLGVRGAEDGPSYALTLAMGAMLAWSVQLADWGDSPMILWTVLVAILVGGGLARSRVYPPLAHLLGLAGGLPFVIWQISVDAEGANVIARSVDTWERMGLWIQAARTGGISVDPLPFSVLLAGLGWVLAYFAGWALLRWQKPWLPTILLGAPMLTNLSYRFGRFEATFIVFTLLAIVLFAHLAAVRVRGRWIAEGTRYPPELRWRGLATAITAGLGVVILAAALPLAKPQSGTLHDYWQTTRAPWKARLEEQALRLFPNVRGRGSRARLRAFEPVLAFRGPISFEQRPVFQVKSDYEARQPARAYSVYTSQGWLTGSIEEVERAPTEAPPLEGTLLARVPVSQTVTATVPLEYALPGDYTLAVEGRGTVAEVVPPLDVFLNMIPGELDPSLPADVRAYGDALRDRFMGANQPVPSVAATLVSLLPPDLELVDYEADGRALRWARVRRAGPEAFDQLAVRLREASEPGAGIEVRRFLSEATDAQLNSAGEEYPLWVTDRYLQLPESLPAAVRDLAARIVIDAGAETPFQKAEAIGDYLRDLGYSQAIEGPRPDEDGVAYFLFDTADEPCPERSPGDPGCEDGKAKGYSQYFGSAQAVMLRSVGVPARMVSGYKAGTWNPETEAYEVKDSDMHGWAQAYFPSYGWIDLESTPGAPEPVRGARRGTSSPGGAVIGAVPFPVDPASELGEQGGGVGGEDVGNLKLTDTGEPGPRIPLWTAGTAAAAVLGLALAVLAWRWRFWEMSPITKSYVSMRRWGWLAGLGHRRWETPREYALKLGARAPGAGEGARLIARGFEIEAYGGRGPAESINAEAREQWPGVRAALIRRGLLRLLGIRGRSRDETREPRPAALGTPYVPRSQG